MQQQVQGHRGALRQAGQDEAALAGQAFQLLAEDSEQSPPLRSQLRPALGLEKKVVVAVRPVLEPLVAGAAPFGAAWPARRARSDNSHRAVQAAEVAQILDEVGDVAGPPVARVEPQDRAPVLAGRRLKQPSAVLAGLLGQALWFGPRLPGLLLLPVPREQAPPTPTLRAVVRIVARAPLRLLPTVAVKVAAMWGGPLLNPGPA
mmetsp:Transcript_36856/g.106313  ORF Transcript_36856/g.106313 Transcript_36856/m.106313 type:complete len:204 (+) Transcript_36856:575-1186(+)